MPYYYKTTIYLKFNKQLNNTGKITCTRTENVTATGQTIADSENAALLQAAFFTSSDTNEKITYELQTIKIKSSRIF
jgi:hypothetical protein